MVVADDAAIFRMLRQVGADGGMVALHAENGAVIDLLIKDALDAGHTSPRYHAMTRPAILEGEATHRGIRLAWPKRAALTRPTGATMTSPR